MKSVAFIGNTWKKWAQKSSENRDDRSVDTQRESPKAFQQSRGRGTAPGRTLTITAKHAPMEDTTATTVDGKWRPTKSLQIPSPIYEHFTQNRSENTLVSRDDSRVGLDVTCQGEGLRYRDSPSSSTSTLPRSPMRSTTALSQTPPGLNPPSYTLSRERTVSLSSLTPSPVRTRKISPTSSLHHPKLPSFHLLPPIDLDYGLGSQLDDNPMESEPCYCGRNSQPTHLCKCPDLSFMEPPSNNMARKRADSLRSSPTSVHSVESKRRSPYHTMGSTPYLPYQERRTPSPRSNSTSSSEGNDTDNFPLSLFPAPPPLIVRKKVPAPLVLRPIRTDLSPVSRDSTPVGTPTTPRFNTPSPQSSLASPTKKHIHRSASAYSPPPFSPPNAPLPSVPASPAMERFGHPLRTVHSSLDLRDPAHPPTHRLTSSEPVGRPNFVSQRTARPRFENMQTKDFQTQMVNILSQIMSLDDSLNIGSSGCT